MPHPIGVALHIDPATVCSHDLRDEQEGEAGSANIEAVGV